MSRLITLLTIFVFSCFTALSQGNYEFKNFSMGPSSGDIFTTNNFKAINVGRDGVIWAGSQYGGLYRYDTLYKIWSKSVHLTNVFINDIKMDRDSGIWIAQSGQAGGGVATHIAGGVNYFSNRADETMQFYSIQGTATRADLWTRNVRGLYVDTAYTTPNARVWAAQGESKSGGEFIGGGLSIGLNDNDPYFSRQKENIDVSNGSNPTAIGGDGKQIWMAVRNNFNRSQILRYNRAGAFVGFYDYTNLPKVFPGAFIVQSIFFDSHGNKWIALLSGGLIIKNETGWHKVSDKTFLSDGLSFNLNAVAEDAYGNVYFGTSKGLLKFKSPRYNVSSDPTLPGNYELISTSDGLIGNYVTGMAYDGGTECLLITTSDGVSFLNLKEPYIKGVAYNVYTGLDTDSLPGYKKIPVKAIVHLIHNGDIKETVVAGDDGVFELKQAEPNKGYTVQVEYRLNPPRITYLYEDVFNHTRLKPALIPDSLIKEMKAFKDKMKKNCVKWNFPLTKIGTIPICVDGFDTTNFNKPFSYFYNPNGITDHELRVDNLANYFATMKLIHQLGSHATDLTIEAADNMWQLFDAIMGYSDFKKGMLSGLENTNINQIDTMAINAVTSMIKGSLNTLVGASKMIVTYLMSDVLKDPYTKSLFDAFLTTFNDACDLLIEALASIEDPTALRKKLIIDNLKKIASIELGVYSYDFLYTKLLHRNLIPDLSNLASDNYSKIPYAKVYNDAIAYGNEESLMFKGVDHYKLTKERVEIANKITNVAGTVADLSQGLSIIAVGMGPTAIAAVKAIGYGAKAIQFLGIGAGISLDVYGVSKQVNYSLESRPSAGFRTRPEERGYGITGLNQPVELHNQLTNYKSKIESLRAAINNPVYSPQTFADGIYGYIGADSSFHEEHTNVLMSLISATDSATLDIPGFAEKYHRLYQVFIDSAQSLREGIVYQVTAFALEENKSGYAPAVDSTLSKLAEMTDSIYNTIASLINDINDHGINSEAYLYANNKVVDHTHMPGSQGMVTYTLKNFGMETMNNVRIKITNPTDGFTLISADSLLLGDFGSGEEKTIAFQFASPISTDSITFGKYQVKVYAENGRYGDITGYLYIQAMGPTPVVLQNFTLKCSGDNNMLTWETASETNASHFNIEGSIDGTNWSTKGTVYAVGNSSVTRNYIFNTPAGDEHFFRLKQVDNDGKFMYSNVLRSHCKPASNRISVYPVPVSNVLNVDITSEKSGVVSLILADMTGRQVRRTERTLIPGANKLQLNTDGLVNGQYVLRIENPWISRTLKITVRR